MSEINLNWNLLTDASANLGRNLINAAGALRQRRTDRALGNYLSDPESDGAYMKLSARDPALAVKARGIAREEQALKARNHLFDPEPPPSTDTTPDAPAPVSSAPTTLLDPDDLPARSDGLTLNKAALRRLYQFDPDGAMKIQSAFFDADERAFKRTQRIGATMAQVAWHLGKIQTPNGQPDLEGRKKELAAWAPELMRKGIPADQLREADLTDEGLNRHYAVGRSLDRILDDERADERLDADIADDEADNERADRNTNSIIADRGARRTLTIRGQDLASRDRRRRQDLTDQRGRTPRPARTGRGNGGAATPTGQTATDPRTGKKVRWDGKDWVPAG